MEMEEKVSDTCTRSSHQIAFFVVCPPPVSPAPPTFTPVKLEHAEQLELGYMPLRDDFEKV